jgi:hypothetical protein
MADEWIVMIDSMAVIWPEASSVILLMGFRSRQRIRARAGTCPSKRRPRAIQTKAAISPGLPRAALA